MSAIGRPEPQEYAPFYAGYVAKVIGDDPLVPLREQRDGALALLRGLGEERGDHRYAPGKWSVKELLGHVVDTERVFAYRALCIARGEAQNLPGFDQDTYVAAARFDQRRLASLVEEYESVRQATLTLFASFTETEWRREGTANGRDVSVRALAFITAGHEAHHLGILRDRYLG